MFACVHVLPSSGERPSLERLVRLARDFSPRVEVVDEATVALDVDGLEHMWGNLHAVGAALRQAAIERGIRCRVAIAARRIAALLMVHGRDAALTVVESGCEAASLAPLPLTVLDRVVEGGLAARGENPASCGHSGNAWGTIPVRTRFGRSSADRRFREARRSAGRMLQIMRRWGLETLGDLAALPRDELLARLGAEGERWQRCARGDERRPLVPASEEPVFEESLELDWPIEGLEPLSFVLGRVLDPLGVRLARADAAAAVLSVRLWLVTRVWHVRTLQLPAPIRDPRVLRTLLLLDLESHPPPAGVDRVTVTATPAPARVVQFSLFEHAGLSAERMTTLLARLTALMGERRCGAPALIDSHRPGAFDVRPFDPGRPSVRRPSPIERAGAVAVLRRFRIPLAARVTVDDGRPVRVSAGSGVGSCAVEACAGPWRTSGHWWELPSAVDRQASAGRWSHDDWDVALRGGGVYRIYRDRMRGGWFVAGMMD